MCSRISTRIYRQGVFGLVMGLIFSSDCPNLVLFILFAVALSFFEICLGFTFFDDASLEIVGAQLFILSVLNQLFRLFP